ncbi:ATP-binding cassette domain-containing protein [Desertimonas flava]|uniref:ATP-binding cassette domain-containing protein n=1 Tax=Desertimonas flava TaxID=2064846 RepID=UPI001969378B|nr:ATP-binding cassette domain-containing protein [Desertimonas flava]
MTSPVVSGDVLLSARGIERVYRLPRTSLFGARGERRALDGVDLDIPAGASIGIVGESGSGKSTLARILLGLDKATAGTVTYRGRDVRPGPPASLRWLRREVQIVFQDPLSSLDPRMTIASIVREPLVGLDVDGDHTERVVEVLSAVGIDPDARHRYPHEFSGGQQQRIAIARAIAPRPRVLVADEPVSALDVSVRAQILDLLAHLMREFHLSLVMVSHDLGVINTLCDDVLVLHRGRCVERGRAADVFRDPTDDYTRRLVAAVPRLP